MKRDYNSNDFGLETRLDILLKKKAEEGVAIYVLLWVFYSFLIKLIKQNETKIALELNSLYTKNKLEKLHRNITVLRHPDNWPLYCNITCFLSINFYKGHIIKKVLL